MGKDNKIFSIKYLIHDDILYKVYWNIGFILGSILLIYLQKVSIISLSNYFLNLVFYLIIVAILLLNILFGYLNIKDVLYEIKRENEYEVERENILRKRRAEREELEKSNQKEEAKKKLEEIKETISEI